MDVMVDYSRHKLVVISEYPVVRESIAIFLEATGIFSVRTDAPLASPISSADEALALCVLDPKPDVEANVRSVKERYPNAKIACIVLGDDQQAIIAALQAGATGIIDDSLGTCSLGHLCEDLERVAKGEFVLSTTQAIKLARLHVTGLPQVQIAKPEWLTNREKEVLSLLADGASNRLIAARLCVSEHTVRAHLRGIMQKLHVSNRLQAAALVWRENMTQEALRTGDS